MQGSEKAPSVPFWMEDNSKSRRQFRLETTWTGRQTDTDTQTHRHTDRYTGNQKSHRKKIREKKNLKGLLELCQSNTFLPMHVHYFFSFFCKLCFAYLIIFELNFFSLQSNRSLCQSSGVKTTAAVVFTPQLRSSG